MLVSRTLLLLWDFYWKNWSQKNWKTSGYAPWNLPRNPETNQRFAKRNLLFQGLIFRWTIWNFCVALLRKYQLHEAQTINGWCLRCWRLVPEKHLAPEHLPAPQKGPTSASIPSYLRAAFAVKLPGWCNFYLRVFQTPIPTESQVWRVLVFGIPQDKTALHVSSGKYRHFVGWFYITPSMDVFKTVPRMNMFLNPSAPNTLLEGV